MTYKFLPNRPRPFCLVLFYSPISPSLSHLSVSYCCCLSSPPPLSGRNLSEVESMTRCLRMSLHVYLRSEWEKMCVCICTLWKEICVCVSSSLLRDFVIVWFNVLCLAPISVFHISKSVKKHIYVSVCASVRVCLCVCLSELLLWGC